MQVTENALRQAPPDLRFFHTTTVTIAGKTVGALRHGMVGQPGWELFGPWEDREAVLEALLTAGEDLGPPAIAADGRTRPIRSSRAGFPRRSRPCTRARA